MPRFGRRAPTEKEKALLNGKAASEIQSVRFDKKVWTTKQAEDWLATHRYAPLKLDITENQLRYRIHPPERYKRMVTLKPTTGAGVPSDKGVSFILGFR